MSADDVYLRTETATTATPTEHDIRADVQPAITAVLAARRRLRWLRERAASVPGHVGDDLDYVLVEQLAPLLVSLKQVAMLKRRPRVRREAEQ